MEQEPLLVLLKGDFMGNTISIIVPVYKTENYLQDCVNSIMNQDYLDFELILVDDGSPDQSGKICDELAAGESKIKVIHKKNGGLSSARNAGLVVATGEYVCFIDSDDYVEKDYLSTLYNLVFKYKTEFAKVEYVEVYSRNYSDTSIDAEKEIVYTGDDVERAYLDLKVDSVCVFLYSRQLIRETRFLEGKTSEDIPFNFEIFQKARSLAYKPVKKYYYYHNSESISNGSFDKNMLNYLTFRRNIYEHYLQKGNAYLIRKSEVLYARAAMGLMARMALYGISKNMNERKFRIFLKKEFDAHCKAFYSDKDVPRSRKGLAVLVFKFYPVAKMLRRFVK